MKKILIVDDEGDVLEVLAARLGLAGYQVIKAHNGKEAVERARIELPDLIILDILMPEMGGEEAGEILRSSPATKDIPIIFLTCLFTKQDEKKDGHTLGKNIFVAKPYDVKELLEIVRRITK
jgi:two-component system, OmpR family, alkaline phosphatase synthesis response regulator PhoP